MHYRKVLISFLIISVVSLVGCTSSTPTQTTEEMEEIGKEEQNEHITMQTTDTKLDLDNCKFSINGIEYTLGVSTMQDMFNNGIVFTEDTMMNKDDTVEPYYESHDCDIQITDKLKIGVRFANFSEEHRKANECLLSYVYVPIHMDKKQTKLQFVFPNDITSSELSSYTNEPSDYSKTATNSKKVAETFEYKKEAEFLYGTSGYRIEFMNGELEYVTIDWLP